MGWIDTFRRPKSFYPKADNGSVVVTYQNASVLRGTVAITCKRWKHGRDGTTRFYNAYGQLVYEIPTADIIGPLQWYSHGG